MITLFIALCLLTSVKPSNIKEIQVKKIKSGEDVTMKCGVFNDKTKLVWFKQSFGKVPQLVGRAVGKDFRLDAEFNDGRFSVRDDKLFNLDIKNVTEEDTGTYFCVEMLNTSPDFTSGTLLVVEDEEMKRSPPAVKVLENGELLTLQCSVQAITSSCEEPSVYWFRHGSGESDPGIIYTHGNASDECKKSSEAGSPPQSCVYTLPKRKLTTSGKEMLYCAVAECGQILFRNGIMPAEKSCCFQNQVMIYLSGGQSHAQLRTAFNVNTVDGRAAVHLQTDVCRVWEHGCLSISREGVAARSLALDTWLGHV
ncbi:uncharacterized protein LOC113635523 [Tachysurus fulvidraco]|uniref:uncharacterized protein LOC113635523 n=1 Tax=Tachysurus fulvidraco TaxID=1234273 RepID=UPI001FEE23BA|nr:uncharacterized protein LOC113635523 [Tachysurus fulvidraco]